MKKSKTQKGITLIALIITIVVLIILAVVTINSIQEDGIIRYAQNAADDYTTKANEEQENLNTLLGQIEESLNEEKEDTPIIHSGTIPEGGKYYYNITTCECGDSYYRDDGSCPDCGMEYPEEDFLNAGEQFPETINTGDFYHYGDYQYCYGGTYDPAAPAWYLTQNADGWGVRYVGGNAEPILETIAGKTVKWLDHTFENCDLEKAPIIPSTVTSLNCTFWGCENLNEAPIIPSSVKNMDCTFAYCTSLEGEIRINANPTIYYSCFFDTQKEITIVGDSSDQTKANLAATATNGNVKY